MQVERIICKLWQGGTIYTLPSLRNSPLSPKLHICNSSPTPDYQLGEALPRKSDTVLTVSSAATAWRCVSDWYIGGSPTCRAVRLLPLQLETKITPNPWLC